MQSVSQEHAPPRSSPPDNDSLQGAPCSRADGIWRSRVVDGIGLLRTASPKLGTLVRTRLEFTGGACGVRASGNRHAKRTRPIATGQRAGMQLDAVLLEPLASLYARDGTGV